MSFVFVATFLSLVVVGTAMNKVVVARDEEKSAMDSYMNAEYRF